MTPREYLDKLNAAMKSNNVKESTNVINEYVNFALNEIATFCNAHVNTQTVSIWVYALREVSKIYSKYESDAGKALMAFFDKHANKDVEVFAMSALEEENDAED